MAKTVLGVFANRDDAEDAINRLEADGYNPKDISIVMKDHKTAEYIRDNTGADVATGGVLGALAGLLVATGIVPGIGAILIGGPVAVALGLTGTAATTLSGATLTGLQEEGKAA